MFKFPEPKFDSRENDNFTELNVENFNLKIFCRLHYVKEDRNNTIGCDMLVADTDELYFYYIYDNINACCLGLYVIKELKEYYNYISAKKNFTADILTCDITYNADRKQDFKIVFKNIENITQIEFSAKMPNTLAKITHLGLLKKIIKNLSYLILNELNNIKFTKDSTITTVGDYNERRCINYYYYSDFPAEKNQYVFVI